METIQETITKLAEELKPALVDFCQRLIRVPALSGAEKGVADLYLAEMEKLGYDRYFRDKWGNVIGIIEGTEPGPAIMYNAHLDHVDTGDYSEWGGYDPYGAEIDVNEMENQDRDGYEQAEVIHGRAAADVKGGGACQIYSGKIMIELRKLGYPIKGRYIFTGVVLEEPAEQLGMIKLIEDTFPEEGIDYDGVVSCEATSLKLYLGHRGRVELQVTVSGTTSHGSAPWLGVNAVNKATKLIDRVEESIAAQRRTDEHLGNSSIALTIINCTPGSMCIVPDRCHITYDRRFVPGETFKGCVEEIQKIIDGLTEEDPEFRAAVEIATVPRTTYTGLTVAVPNVKQAWKISPEHPFAKAAAAGLSSIGQPVKYGYWDFGTDLSVICGREKKPAIGYSPMQEFYCHRPVDKVRIDYMVKALAGNVAIYQELTALEQKDFIL
ncbi:peptidase dimerization domain protein [Syntrophobotulus glycolicus DSM 8271]|uniref:Peptidase dimerization domain protein n=1 Tax=Syntrophobotulus glycolicus (strain DSM 8271 / FlGlyR) TaxID=645991 RepID=F0SVX4_SYNGF|nr:M20/M25/M40 family metallo-hydrolase [Syntrophobotulus glycolicus]ADY55680.1 peptidase dimerization domain protein [Syntrophobotulus glycolicus DSM 8271]